MKAVEGQGMRVDVRGLMAEVDAAWPRARPLTHTFKGEIRNTHMGLLRLLLAA